jgi:hypothetical protein
MGYVIPSAFWWVIALGYLLFEGSADVAHAEHSGGSSRQRWRASWTARAASSPGGERTARDGASGHPRFTTISEGMTPAILLGHLNRF